MKRKTSSRVLFWVLIFITLSITKIHAQIDYYKYSKELTKEEFGIGFPEALSNPESTFRLSMNGKGLEELPEGLREFKNLRQLQISNNNLTELPIWIVELDKLEILWLGGNQNLELEQSFNLLSQLPLLKMVWIGNETTTVVENILRLLKGVKTIVITRNEQWALESIINEVICLPDLENLELSFRSLKSIPPNFKELNFLKELSFEYSDIPNEIKTKIIGLLPKTKIYF